MSEGLFHIYYGNGKGKTTSCTGLSIRMAGSGGKVLYAFMQKGMKSSEVRLMENMDNIDVMQVCTIRKFSFLLNDEERKEYTRQHENGFDKIRKKVKNSEYSLVVIDEMLGALKENALKLSEVIEFIDEPRNYDIVFSGREAPDELIERADYVSRIEEVKHPYQKGIKGRKGIEF